MSYRSSSDREFELFEIESAIDDAFRDIGATIKLGELAVAIFKKAALEDSSVRVVINANPELFGQEAAVREIFYGMVEDKLPHVSHRHFFDKFDAAWDNALKRAVTAIALNPDLIDTPHNAVCFRKTAKIIDIAGKIPIFEADPGSISTIAQFEAAFASGSIDAIVNQHDLQNIHTAYKWKSVKSAVEDEMDYVMTKFSKHVTPPKKIAFSKTKRLGGYIIFDEISGPVCATAIMTRIPPSKFRGNPVDPKRWGKIGFSSFTPLPSKLAKKPNFDEIETYLDTINPRVKEGKSDIPFTLANPHTLKSMGSALRAIFAGKAPNQSRLVKLTVHGLYDPCTAHQLRIRPAFQITNTCAKVVTKPSISQVKQVAKLIHACKPFGHKSSGASGDLDPRRQQAWSCEPVAHQFTFQIAGDNDAAN